jgi:hypothetical protein
MRTILLLVPLLFLPLTDGVAADVDLYEGKASVAGKDASERRHALPAALRHVLQKISGVRDFTDYPQVELALDRAASMVLAFSYRNDEVLLADGSLASELRLVVDFSPPRVDELARQLALPLWQPERVPIEVWVVLDDGLDRRIFPVEWAYAWRSMDEAAVRRGLTLRWPQPDEEGVYSLDAGFLWGGYTEDLAGGHQGGVMIAAARREGVAWSVRNNLSYERQDWTWRVQDIDLQSALLESLQQAIDRVAAANTIAASDLGAAQQDLTVTGLNSAAAYQRLLDYLQQISVVDAVTVVAAERGMVRFRLGLKAQPQYLEQALASDGILEFDASDGLYRLLP